MVAIAGRSDDARRHRQIEARLVVHQDDVRRFSGRLAGFAADDREALGHGSVGLEQSAREIVAGRSDAGAAELRDIAVAVEFLVRIARRRIGERRQAGNADGAARRCRAQPHP